MWAWAETLLLTACVSLSPKFNNSLWESEKISSHTSLLWMRATILFNFHPPVHNRRIFVITINVWHNYGKRSLWRGIQMYKWIWFAFGCWTNNWWRAHKGGHKSGLVGRIQEKMMEQNVTGQLTAFHCIIQNQNQIQNTLLIPGGKLFLFQCTEHWNKNNCLVV